MELEKYKYNDYLEEIHPNIWLMNNHKWAYFVWQKLKYKNNTIPSTLLHIDYHWDGINDFHNKIDVTKKFIKLNKLPQIYDMVKKNDLIKADSFIAPAVIKKIINEIHFYCFQNGVENGLDASLLQENAATQYIHKTQHSIIKIIGNKSIIFDLDLDVFNKSKNTFKPDIWPKKDIKKFLHNLSGIIKNSCIITIAISRIYGGYSLENIKSLLEIVIPCINANKNLDNTTI